MDSKRAAEVLTDLYEELSPRTPEDDEACKLGAQALEAWAWVERTGELPYRHDEGWAALGKAASGEWVFGTGPTPIAAVLDAMQKEKG